MSQKIIFVHLLNDYSGSPKVLKEVVSGLSSEHPNSILYTGSFGDGFLSFCKIKTKNYWYSRTYKKIKNLINYLNSQVVLFCKLLFDRDIDKNAIIYVNTILPFSAAVFGKITKRKVIYHLHEISIAPELLKKLLILIVKMTSSLNIYVSMVHQNVLEIPSVPYKIVYNSLDNEFLKQAENSCYSICREKDFVVLMISVLKDFKGIPEFILLAKLMHEYKTISFELLLNDTEESIKRYFSAYDLPTNLKIFSKTSDTMRFYKRSSLVVNLTRVDICTETFGLTLLEAMSFGVPVIAPPIGGPSELIQNGKNGYLIDSRDIEKIKKVILKLSMDRNLWNRLSQACLNRARDFSPIIFQEEIKKAVNDVIAKNAIVS